MTDSGATIPVRPFVRVSSMALSGTSLRRLTSAEQMDLSLVPWQSLEVKEWMVEFRRAVKIRFYALIYEVKRAMLVFEDAKKTNYSHYHTLKSVCTEIWRAWRAFTETKEVDGKALEAPPVFVDFLRLPAAMVTPRGTRKKQVMSENRVAARAAIGDMDELKGTVDGILHSLQENEDDKGESEETDHSTASALTGVGQFWRCFNWCTANSGGPHTARGAVNRARPSQVGGLQPSKAKQQLVADQV